MHKCTPAEMQGYFILMRPPQASYVRENGGFALKIIIKVKGLMNFFVVK